MSLRKQKLLNKLFIKAVKQGNLDEIKNLLHKGADINSNNAKALFFAVQQQNIPIIDYLLDNKISGYPRFVVDLAFANIL